MKVEATVRDTPPPGRRMARQMACPTPDADWRALANGLGGCAPRLFLGGLDHRFPDGRPAGRADCNAIVTPSIKR